MRGKRNIMALIIFWGIILLAGAVSIIIKYHFYTIEDGTVDLSDWNGIYAIALIGNAGSEYDCIHVDGAIPGESLALRFPPDLADCRVYIDGNIAQQNDGSVLHYEVSMVKFAPALESFDIEIQPAESDVSTGELRSVYYLGTATQIDRLNSVICGYDIFIIAFLFIVICYNIFYVFGKMKVSQKVSKMLAPQMA